MRASWKVTDAPVWDLGVWEPSRLFPSEDEFHDWLKARATTVVYPEMRDPGHQWSMASGYTGGFVNTFHRDGGKHGHQMYLAVWSNMLGTVFRAEDNPAREMQAEPGHVVLINNVTHRHRTPYVWPGLDISDRWFARACLSMEARVYDTPQLRRLI